MHLTRIPHQGIAIRINDAPYRCHKCDLPQVIPVNRTDRPSVPKTGPSHAKGRGKTKAVYFGIKVSLS